jgi:flagellar biosynthetic protein FliP
MRNILKLSSILQILFIIFVSTSSLEAETLFESFGVGLPAINVSDTPEGETTYSLSLQILALMTVLTVLPSLILGMTSFTRIIIVLSILRQAMGTQQTPPNQVLIAVALFLTLFIMSPTLSKINNESLSPYLSGDLTAENAISKASNTVKDFLVFNTRKNDLQMFADLAGDEKYESNYEVPLPVLSQPLVERGAWCDFSHRAARRAGGAEALP